MTGFTNTNSASQAGLMFRNSTASTAAFAAVLDTPGNGVEFVWRSTDNSPASTTTKTGITAPVWLELVRSGSSFTRR